MVKSKEKEPFTTHQVKNTLDNGLTESKKVQVR